MTREQAINYLISSGFTHEQIGEVVRALTYEPTTKNDSGVDCVSRQEVLDLIADYDLSMGQVVKGIHALPSVTPQEPRWIPCSERVPNESGMYLVTGHWKGEPYEVWLCEFMCLGELKGWANDAKRPIVIAWMPLPEPYKAESEADNGNDD